MTKRRKFLKGIASTSLFGAVQGVTAESSSDNTVQPLGAGGAGNDEKLPVYADGRLVSHYRPDTSHEDRYILERKFESADLTERYGDPVFRYSDVLLSEKLVPEKVKTGRKTTYTSENKLVVGKDSEHRNAEEKIWNEESDTATTLDIPEISDTNIPLFHYDPDASGSGMDVRSSPMNVAWETDYASGIQAIMRSEGWNSTLQLIDELTIDKEIKLPDGNTKSTDEHVTKGTGSLCPSDQTHVRLYDLSDLSIDGLTTIGQAHIDPCDHGKWETWSPIGGGLQEVDYQIDSARDAVAEFWDNEDDHSIDSEDVGNTHKPEFDSHSGKWKLIEGEY
ncbi:hypothetical protein GOC74_04380 [Halomicrobium mukohataei]|uniref:Uncharacterized protein n=1 Tax=Halomicrobium mukohataei TaxID=57705 RepID=A0A847U775_9EURY|nr:hypothetical protein [Halomicrobium mukohataei]NLV09165.1 hypothetical protein [Halomicrobium mukohataei]